MAHFDLYNHRRWWWWYYYLSLAAAKGTPAHIILEQLIYEAIEYEDNKLDKESRQQLLDKYSMIMPIKGSEKL